MALNQVSLLCHDITNLWLELQHRTDEIMQQESSPLCAIDITPDLRKQFAFLSGGRGQNGSPIIVFPEFPAFGEIQEREFHNVLTYLTSIPSLSAAGVGFILVIDRRQDRWTAVKATLLRIAGSFPGNLQLVLVLRPTTLFQRTLSDILFKFNKDEFKMKVPAIEGFALMVKRTAQILQSFGTKLAETELPNDIQATSNLLGTHTNKKSKMKEDLLVALGQGSRLLESINEPVVRDPDHNMNQDELENLATVQRLLSQLNETERAFDEFWVRHQTKLEQCLLLRHFEHNYREVRCLLDQVAERLTAFSEVGISPAHADHIFRELSSHEERVCEVLDQAQALAREGDKLIQSSHYAEDSIQPKCIELRAAAKWCDDGIYLLASQPVDKCQSHDGAESALQEIERYLDTAGQNKLTDPSAICRDYETVLNHEFKDQVEKVFQKQVSMQEMFEKRRVSLKKLAAKQTRPVQPVAPRPEAIKSPLSSPAKRVLEKSCSEGDSVNGVSCRKVEGQLQSNRSASLSEEDENLAILRKHVMNELLETEKAYVEELLCVLQGYASEMDNPAMTSLMPIPLQNKKDVLFGNMPEIYHFHKRTFLRELEEYEDCPELVGRCFLERECQKKLEHKLGLDSYLLKPVQRITKYQLLLKELLKYSKGCEGSEDLQEALTSILGILKAVNDSMHLIAITGYDGNMGDLGRLLMQGSFSVWTEHKKGHAKVKDLARFKPMQRHLFLHEKALLFCDNKKFEVWCNSREEVYIVQAPTSEVKTTWVKEIRKVLTTQLEAYREASQQRPSDGLFQFPPGAGGPVSLSPFRRGERSMKEKGEPSSPDANSRSFPKTKEEAATSPTSDRAAVAKKRFTLQGFSNYNKGSPTSPDHKTKRHEIKSDPTPFGFKDPGTHAHLHLGRVRWLSTSSLLQAKRRGKYTVVSDYEKGEAQDLSVKSGETVQLIKERDDGQWFVKNLKTKQEGWVAAANLLTLIGESKSCQSLTSSEGSGSGNLSNSSSCCHPRPLVSRPKPNSTSWWLPQQDSTFSPHPKHNFPPPYPEASPSIRILVINFKKMPTID
ncbi:unnamed protein product [Coregonus sp. 'balchen']|nr:unnamed protein product [Coregonus sp. 'balchen']